MTTEENVNPAAVAALLRDTAGIIRERGLAQGHPRDREGRVCSIYGLSLAAERESLGSRPLYRAGFAAMQRFIGPQPEKGPLTPLAIWSDMAPDAEYVAQMFEKCAAALEEMVV